MQMGNLSPVAVSFKKTVQFQGKLLTSSFLQAAVAGPILGIDFLRKFEVTVVPDINQIQFACTAAALPALFLPSAASPTPSLPSATARFQFQRPRLPCHVCLAYHRSQLQFQFSCPLQQLLPSLLPYPHMLSGIPR